MLLSHFLKYETNYAQDFKISNYFRRTLLAK